MINKKELSNEAINSLVDNEFSATERAQILSDLSTNEEDKKRLCHVNNLKDLVNTAYQDIPASHYQKQTKIRVNYWVAMVASILVTLFAGLIYQSYISKTPQRIVLLDPSGSGQQVSNNLENELRIVFHVSNSTQKNAKDILDDIEGLLQQAKEERKNIRVEVVAHAEGLDLLRQRLSTEKKRITQMSHDYPDLTFVACLNTVRRLKVEKGIVVSLIPEAITTKSGVAYIVQRQKEGWLYIQI